MLTFRGANWMVWNVAELECLAMTISRDCLREKRPSHQERVGEAHVAGSEEEWRMLGGTRTPALGNSACKPLRRACCL